MINKILLGCGAVSSALYVISDVIAARRYDGYSYSDQWFSELTAEGAPTRPLMIVINGIPYTALMTAFAMGIWKTAGQNRAQRLTAALLGGYAAAGIAGGVGFPMATRDAEASLRNIMHIPSTMVMSLCILAAMGTASRLFGNRFRYYSYSTIAAAITFGVLTSSQAGKISNNQPTPWAGIEERINIYATMLWLAMLSIGLLRALRPTDSRTAEKPAVTALPMHGLPQ
jgi:uncharacterized protein DUF998